MFDAYKCVALLLPAVKLEDIETIVESSLTRLVPRIDERLIVWIQSEQLADEEYQDWHRVHKLLTGIYIRAAQVTHRLKRPLLSIDVVLRVKADEFYIPSSLGCEAIFQRSSLSEELTQHTSDASSQAATATIPPNLAFGTAGASYPVVAIGGTFDHLHLGHKILLSMSALLASEKLIIGMTNDSLLKNKKYVEVLEPLSERTRRTREFVELFKPTIVYDLPPLNDIAGPTGWDPNVQALVVSKETISGATAIAKIRAEKSFPPLKEFVIDVISPEGTSLPADDPAALKNLKISSTSIREYIVNLQQEK